jgi:hypothetical protein
MFERLVADPHLRANGQTPSAEKMEAALVLHDYRLATRSSFCLVGMCINHPKLDGPMITTSDLWVDAPGLGWSRTLNRFYRLGPWPTEVTCCHDPRSPGAK